VCLDFATSRDRFVTAASDLGAYTCAPNESVAAEAPRVLTLELWSVLLGEALRTEGLLEPAPVLE
jgi:hypothetical protein